MSDSKEILDKFNCPGAAFQEAMERFTEVVSYLKTNTSIQDYRLQILPNITNRGIIEGYFIEGLIKTEAIETDEFDGEEYSVTNYLSIIKFYLEYTGDKLQEKYEAKKDQIKNFKNQKKNPKNLEEKIWVLTKL